jgi:peptidoglycan/LPS O-acetylase OafA/YrhL
LGFGRLELLVTICNNPDMHGAPQRNEQLDGLRGYAALAVVYFHSILGADLDLIGRMHGFRYTEVTDVGDLVSRIALDIFNGDVAVKLFFILSGAVLFESLTQDSEPAFTNTLHFLVRRFFRIYPALFVCVLLCWASYHAFSIPVTTGDLLRNLALYDFQVVGASWTLNVEAWGALLLVAFFLAHRMLGEFGLLLVAVLVGKIFGGWFKDHLVYFNGYVYCFTLGALVSTRLGKVIIGALPTASWPLLLIGTMFARHAIQDTVAALLIGLIYYRKAGALGTFLARPASVFLGRMSYSFYLFNVLFLGIIGSMIHGPSGLHFHPVVIGLVSGTVVSALTIPLAWLSERFIERPFILIGRRLTEGKSQRDAALVPGELTQSS